MVGHGHVTPRPDGFRARCGGPGICETCSREAAVAYPLRVAAEPASAPMGWECPRCRAVHAPFVPRCSCAAAPTEYVRPEPTLMPGEPERR